MIIPSFPNVTQDAAIARKSSTLRFFPLAGRENGRMELSDVAVGSLWPSNKRKSFSLNCHNTIKSIKHTGFRQELFVISSSGKPMKVMTAEQCLPRQTRHWHVADLKWHYWAWIKPTSNPACSLTLLIPQNSSEELPLDCTFLAKIFHEIWWTWE